MSRSIVWAALALPGCPFIFEAPDFSNVPHPGTDSETTDSEVPTDSGTTPPPGAPRVVQFEVVPELDRLALRVALLEGDAPLVGGSVVVSDGDSEWTLAIPVDFDVWDASGTSLATIAPWAHLPCTGYSADLQVVAIDSADVASAQVVRAVEVGGLGVLPEVVGGSEVTPTTASWTACVEFDSEIALADQEDVAFTAFESGTYTLALGAEAEVDLDLVLRSSTGVQLTYDWGYGYVPAVVQYDLTAGADYLAVARLFSAAPESAPPFVSHLLVRKE